MQFASKWGELRNGFRDWFLGQMDMSVCSTRRNDLKDDTVIVIENIPPKEYTITTYHYDFYGQKYGFINHI